MIAIEQNVPIAPLGRDWKHPIPSLEVGESFLVPEGNRNSLSASVCRYSKQTGRKFRVRQFREGVRVWRTA